MSNQAEQNYHSSRQAFVIIKGVGVLFLEKGCKVSHFEAMEALGLEKSKIDELLNKNPRGYYKNEVLGLYQGDFIPLTEENLKIVFDNIKELKSITGVDDTGMIWNGFNKGKPGE